MVVLAVVITATLLGGFLQGCVGFGMAMLMVPMLLLVLPAKTAMPMMVCLSLVNTSSIMWFVRRDLQARILLPLSMGALLGIPIGVAILANFAGPGFKFCVGIILTVFGVVMFRGWEHPVRNERAGMVGVGFLGGLMNGSISMGGPPTVLFLANQDIPRDAFRANLLAFFCLLNGATLGVFAMHGDVSREVIRLAVYCTPAVLLSTYAGAAVSHRISQNLFRRLTLLLITISGVLLVIRFGPSAWGLNPL